MVRSREAVALVAVAASLVACAQVTGLSDDYTFNLVTDAGGGTDGGDAGKDGATDGGGTEGGAGQCTSAQVGAANTILATLNGTADCKSCLATQCCTDVTTCSSQQDCKSELSCDLDCTTKEANSKQQCFRGCQENGVPQSYTNGVGKCANQQCKQVCGFP
jgi:hypothetical protein